MLARILAVFRKEFIQLRRDRRTAAMAVAMPLMFLLIFGYAANFNVTSFPTAVVRLSNAAAAKDLESRIWADGSFERTELSATTVAALKSAIKNGRVRVGVVLPKGYGESSGVQPVIYTDGADLFSSQSAAARTMKVFQAAMADQAVATREAALSQVRATPLAAFLPKAIATMARPKPARIVFMYNEGLKSSYVMIPALVGLVLAFILTLLTALGIVRERERGTLEQLLVTPIKPAELMIGKLLPYIVIGLLDLALVVGSGLLIFDVPFRGQVAPFAAASLAFLVCGLAQGLLISTISQNQQQAMQLAMFTVMPQVILSGFIFPLTAMAPPIRALSYIFPLTYFIPVARACFLKPGSVEGIWTNVLVLCGYAVLLVVLASVRFRKQQV